MKTKMHLKRLMVFVDETDKYHGKNLATVIVDKAKHAGCSGATVLRGIIGYGSHKQVHTAALVDLSVALPEVVLIIDTAEKIEALMPELEEVLQEGLVIVDDVEALKFSIG